MTHEILDLHPRVCAFLEMWDFHVINEYRYLGGGIDFLAIDRATGDLVVVECKTAIHKTQPVIDQINRYAQAVNVPSVHRWIFTFSASDDQRSEFKAHGIETFALSMESPVSNSVMVDLDQMCWYYYKWHTEPLLPYCYSWRTGALNVTPYPYPIDTTSKRYNPKKHSLRQWRQDRMLRLLRTPPGGFQS